MTIYRDYLHKAMNYFLCLINIVLFFTAWGFPIYCVDFALHGALVIFTGEYMAL